jgi:hypothetical protein
MRTIRELNENEKNQIVASLIDDNFEQVKSTDKSILFKKQYRTFELISTDITQEDMGIRVDFDQDFLFSKENKSESESLKSFLKNKTHKSKLKKYQEKSRTSVSFIRNQDLFLDDEEAIESINGWKVVEAYSLALDEAWQSEIHSPTVYHIQIHGKDHSIINDKVYEGTPDIYLSMGKIDVSKFFENTKFIHVLDTLNKES